MRIISWNLHFRRAAVAEAQGELLRELRPDLILLQEVNPGSAEILWRAAGADWLICAADLRARTSDDRRVCSGGVAIAGRGKAPRHAWVPADVSQPGRILLAGTTVDGIGLSAVSYHAPPGASWGLVKPRQGRRLRQMAGYSAGPWAALMGCSPREGGWADPGPWLSGDGGRP